MNVDPKELYWIPAAILLLSCISLIRLVANGRLLTMVGGLHTNMALLLGVGPIAYINYFSNNPEKFSLLEPRVFDQLEQFGPYLVGGYFIWLVIDAVFIRYDDNVNLKNVTDSITTTFLIVMMAVSIMGYLVSSFEFATAGLGTLFPVIKNFMYPVLLISVLKIRATSMESISMAVIVMAIVGFLSFYSAWRSELIIFIVTVTMAVMIRAPRFTPVLMVIVILGSFFLFPFLQYKKTYYQKFKEDPFGAFIESQDIDLDERQNSFFQFISTRINGIREIGYVDRAVKDNIIGYRNGETYSDALLQLIPRVIWPDKPEFNQLVNSWLPRQIGLVDRNDQATSWGVNIFAEFIWNFPTPFLLLFIPFVFAIFTLIDKQTKRIFVNKSTYLIASSTLFFISLSLVGFVMTTTYVMWNLIVMKVVDNRNYSSMSSYHA